MAAPKIEVKRDWQALRIYINDLIHYQCPMENYDGVESWYEGSQNRTYFIQINRQIGNPHKLAYDEAETWKEILKQLDKKI